MVLTANNKKYDDSDQLRHAEHEYELYFHLPLVAMEIRYVKVVNFSVIDCKTTNNVLIGMYVVGMHRYVLLDHCALHFMTWTLRYMYISEAKVMQSRRFRFRTIGNAFVMLKITITFRSYVLYHYRRWSWSVAQPGFPVGVLSAIASTANTGGQRRRPKNLLWLNTMVVSNRCFESLFRAAFFGV